MMIATFSPSRKQWQRLSIHLADRDLVLAREFDDAGSETIKLGPIQVEGNGNVFRRKLED